MQNKYVLETNDIASNNVIAEFALKTLKIQPYQRFRNYKMLNTFISNQI